MSDHPHHAVTIADVAAHAGVSKATVSRVINGNPRVAPTLQERVVAAVEALGYQPDRAARRLRSNASEVLGLIISDIQNPYFTAVVRGVEDTAYEHGMNVLLCNSDEDAEKQAAYIRLLRAERAAGLIVSPSSTQDQAMLAAVREAGTPVVLIDRRVEGEGFDSVMVDNVRGAQVATAHLLDGGRQRVALVGGPLDITTGRDRWEGYLRALSERGVPRDGRLIRTESFKLDAGYTMTRDLLAGEGRPDAIFAANNLLTLGALKAIREAGLRVPDDVALVGFDETPWAAELDPPLTTVSQPTYDLGREAARLLLARLHTPSMPVRRVTLQTRLIVRASCGAASRSG